MHGIGIFELVGRKLGLLLLGAFFAVTASAATIDSASAPVGELDDTDAGETDWFLQVDVNFNEAFEITYIDSNPAVGMTPFQIETGSPTDTLHLDSSGNVGLGTGLPTEALHVRRATGKALARMETLANAATGDQAGFVFVNGGAAGAGQHTWDVRIGGVGNLIFNYNSGGSEFTYTTGGNLIIQGTLTESSSRTAKRNIAEVDSQAVLEKVLSLPIAHWRYRNDQTNALHLGPMAEDFHAAFGLGADDKGISTLDTSGVALAAIQGLKEEKDAEIEALRKEKDAEITELKDRLAALEKLVLAQSDVSSR